MRRYLILLAAGSVVLVGLVAASSAPKPAAPGDCTWKGGPGRDVRTGTARPDVLCAEGGDDFVHGRGGNDVIRAGSGRDVAVGGAGRDVIKGGSGNDRLFAVDDRGGELIICGPGRDQAFVDPGDRVKGCERIFRSQEPALAEALGDSLGEVMEIVEDSPTPTVGPPVATVTETITIGATVTIPFPACEKPGAQPPFC